MIKIFNSLFFCLFVFFAQSQDTIDFKEVNDKTFQYYSSQQWDSLILTGELGLKNNIDYFYLRSRLGVAYFEKKNYTNAATHFIEALKFNESDNFVIEYLYYCYLNLGWTLEANALLKKNPDLFKDKISTNIINECFLDGGVSLIEKNARDIIENNIKIKDSQWLESTLTKQINYGGTGLNYIIGKNLLITHYVGYLDIDNTKKIKIGPSYLDDNFKLSQIQLYSNLTYLLSNGISVTPAFHYVIIDFTTLFSTYDLTYKKVTTVRQNTKLNNYVTSLALSKKVSFLDFNIFGTYSNLNNFKQTQLGTTISVFPLGNMNLYGLSSFTMQSENNISNIVADFNVGCKIFKYLWADGFITYGKLKNFVEKNAFVVQNMNETINFRYGASLILPINNFKITLKYQHINKTSNYNYYQNANKSDVINYNSQQFLVSLAWKINGNVKK